MKRGDAIERLTTAIVNKIIHAPLIALKQETNSEDGAIYIEAVRKLFNLDKSARTMGIRRRKTRNIYFTSPCPPVQGRGMWGSPLPLRKGI